MSLVTTTEVERVFIQAQIAFERNQGNVLGQELSGLDTSQKVDLLGRLIDEAERRGLRRQAQAFQAILSRLFAEREGGDDVSAAKPTDGESLERERADLAQQVRHVEELESRVRDLDAQLSAAEAGARGGQ